jgi:hypothetical protein
VLRLLLLRLPRPRRLLEALHAGAAPLRTCRHWQQTSLRLLLLLPLLLLRLLRLLLPRLPRLLLLLACCCCGGCEAAAAAAAAAALLLRLRLRLRACYCGAARGWRGCTLHGRGSSWRSAAARWRRG